MTANSIQRSTSQKRAPTPVPVEEVKKEEVKKEELKEEPKIEIKVEEPKEPVIPQLIP